MYALKGIIWYPKVAITPDTKITITFFSFLKVNFSHVETNTIIIANTAKKKTLENLGISLKKRGIKVDISELKSIEETINSFHDNKS